MIILEYGRPIMGFALLVLAVVFYFVFGIEEPWLLAVLSLLGLLAISCFAFYFWASWEESKRERR